MQSLKREGIDCVQADNCFLHIDNMERAQELADSLSPDMLHKHLDKYAQQLCPILDVFGQAYHWSIRQIEYSTDLMFKSADILTPLYDTRVVNPSWPLTHHEWRAFWAKKSHPCWRKKSAHA